MSSRARRRKKTNELDLDITSLLDILTILLVFLLQSYNASDLEVNLVDNMKIPDSASRTFGHTATQIQVNKDRAVFINNKMIGTIKDNSPLIDFLLYSLRQERTIASENDNTQQSSKTINLILDESLNYETMRQVMHTAATAGFPQFKLIVQGNNE